MSHKRHLENILSNVTTVCPPVESELLNYESFNKHQANIFDENSAWYVSQDAIPEEVVPRLDRIVKTAFSTEQQNNLRSLSVNCLDVGAGAGALTGRIQALVPQASITAIDLSKNQLKNLGKRFPAVHCWQGDIVDYRIKKHALVDKIWVNACFANFFSQEMALKAMSRLLINTGSIVISHPLARKFVNNIHELSPEIVPHTLPKDLAQAEDLAQGLPLKVTQFVNDEDIYLLEFRVSAP